MSAKISDLMQTPVFTLQRHHTVARARKLMQEHAISAVPIVGPEDELAGIVSKTDLLADLKDATPLSNIMAEHTWSVPQYNDAHVAARVMRKHGVHHVVVTHEKKVVGVISAMDLLQLVENHRFVMKPGAK
ncbi:MAG: CBS domain-containing protein [Planctomycetota bacterium]|nr:CBS domain-containing protein [Planctomycetota bacterium]